MIHFFLDLIRNQKNRVLEIDRQLNEIELQEYIANNVDLKLYIDELKKCNEEIKKIIELLK